MPNRVFPVVRSFVLFYNKLAVYVYAKACDFRQGNVTIYEIEIAFIVNVIKDAFAYIIVNTYALLLNYCVIARCINVKAGGKRNRS